MINNSNFEYTTNLQYKVKTLTARLAALESGEKYVSMRLNFKNQLSEKEREIKKLKQELASANSLTVTVRENWQEVFEDIESAHAKELKAKDREIESLKNQLFKRDGKIDEMREKLRKKSIELYESLTALEEEKGRNQKLKAQINRDYENSSIPSSMKQNCNKISNNREKTGRKPGGQPGHKGHGRKRLTPTNIVNIPAPEEYVNSSEYKPTGKIITKQIIDMRIDVIVNEYNTPEYRNVHSGQRVHAKFPGNIVNDINYGGSVKSFAFLLNNRCFVSIDKVREFLSELTDGELSISKGMINGLAGEFSKKTEAEQKAAFSDILLSPVMNTDFTAARMNGKNVQINVCATPQRVMYFARKHKGHEGVKGTPIEDYQGIMVHDHDKTFYNYGDGHQECNSHPLRYLKDSMENEPALSWNRRMRELLRETIHYRNGLSEGEVPDSQKVETYESRYDEILEVAREEYEYEPPGKYYRDGYNLYKRLGDYKKNHLLFLHDPKVPATNNLSERLLRVFKRKQKQVMTFRSFDSLSHLCCCMGVIESLRAQGKNLYKNISEVLK